MGPFRQSRKNPLFFLVTGTGNITELASQALRPGLGIFSAKIQPARHGFAVQIELDGLTHPLGSVTVGECEEYSVRLTACIDEAVRANNPAIPVGLTEENYTLEVSSAGAERELRLPQELDRFLGPPIKVLYKNVEGKLETAVVVCQGKQEDGSYAFETYVSRRRKGKGKPKTLKLMATEMQKANLFLDF